MTEIDIPLREREALRAIDTTLLRKLVDQCISEEHSSALGDLRRKNYGLFVGTKLSDFEAKLSEYSKAKAPKKRAGTGSDARRAGDNLLHAVEQMKVRVESEEKEQQLFYVDDWMLSPTSFGETLTVRVSYRWRNAVEDAWTSGSILFSYNVESRTDYLLAPSTRKPSASKREQDNQRKLHTEWEHLKMLGLHSVRDFFRGGGCGSDVPQSFQVKVDSYSRGLNNFSAQFWSSSK